MVVTSVNIFKTAKREKSGKIGNHDNLGGGSVYIHNEPIVPKY